MGYHKKNEWDRLVAEYALVRAEYQAAREGVDASPNMDRMTAALLAEDQARERLIAMRRSDLSTSPTAALDLDSIMAEA
jgi:hypothetical protein